MEKEQFTPTEYMDLYTQVYNLTTRMQPFVFVSQEKGLELERLKAAAINKLEGYTSKSSTVERWFRKWEDWKRANGVKFNEESQTFEQVTHEEPYVEVHSAIPYEKIWEDVYGKPNRFFNIKTIHPSARAETIVTGIEVAPETIRRATPEEVDIIQKWRTSEPGFYSGDY